MAYRMKNCWSLIANSLRGSNTTGYATSTAPRTKAYAAPAASYARVDHPEKRKARLLKSEYVPVYMSVGLITLQFAIGIFTIVHQLKNCPNVTLKKKRREMVAEVDDPELVAEEADKFFRKSFFRKIAHIQDSDNAQHAVPDPIRGDAYAYRPHVETLKDVGVDPKSHHS